MAKIDLRANSAKKDAGRSITEQLSELMSRDFQISGSSLSYSFKEQLYSDLHVLIVSGLDIRSSLDLIFNESKEGKVKKVLGVVREAVYAGRSLGDVLSETEGFTEYEVQSVRIGEETGAMAEIFGNLSNDFRERIKMRRELVTAFSYPLMVTGIAVLAVGFMMTFVVPLFSDLFQRLGQDLPWLTQQVIAFSEFVSSYWWFLVLIIAGTAALWVYAGNQPNVRLKMDSLLLRIPLLGSILKESVMARFTGSMSFMLKSQVSLLRALKLSADMTEFSLLKRAAVEIEEGLIKGQNLTTLISNNPLFDNRFSAMVKVGEEVNQLDRVFSHLSEQYSEQIQRRTKTLSTFLEPLMIAFLGMVVGTILIAMYLPLFEMNSAF